MLHKLFYIFTIGVVVGIAFRSFFDFGWSFAVFIIALGIILYSLGSRGPKFLAVAIFFAAAGLGMLRFDFADVSDENFVLDKKVGQEIVIVGTVIDEPDERENNTRIIIEPIILTESELFGARGTKYSKITFPRGLPRWDTVQS